MLRLLTMFVSTYTFLNCDAQCFNEEILARKNQFFFLLRRIIHNYKHCNSMSCTRQQSGDRKERALQEHNLILRSQSSALNWNEYKYEYTAGLNLKRLKIVILFTSDFFPHKTIDFHSITKCSQRTITRYCVFGWIRLDSIVFAFVLIAVHWPAYCDHDKITEFRNIR